MFLVAGPVDRWWAKLDCRKNIYPNENGSCHMVSTNTQLQFATKYTQMNEEAFNMRQFSIIFKSQFQGCSKRRRTLPLSGIGLENINYNDLPEIKIHGILKMQWHLLGWIFIA
jgi:hypothetical protein